MKYILIVGVWMFLSVNARADVFKTPGEGISQEEDVVNALSKDVRGNYFRNGGDYRLGSNLGEYEYTPGEGLERGAINKNYGKFDLYLGLKEYFQRKGFGLERTNQMIKQTNDRRGDMRQLMLLQYSSPAQADLLKHFHTTGLLRVGIRSQQYSQLQQAVQDPIYNLSARSQLLCIAQYLKDNSANASIDVAFDKCENQEAFTSLVRETSVSRGVLRKALGGVGAPNDVKNFILSAMGDINLRSNDFDLQGPQERVGDVLEKARQQKLKDIDDVVRGFVANHEINENQLDKLSVPGVHVQEYQIRNLALLNKDQSAIAQAQLASQLAYVDTLQKYNAADEYLRRALENPNVDPAYKPFVQERRQFLNEELSSLVLQKQWMQDYAQTAVAHIDQADQERMRVIKQME